MSFRCLFKGHTWGSWKSYWDIMPHAAFIGLIDGKVKERKCSHCGKRERDGNLYA